MQLAYKYACHTQVSPHGCVKLLFLLYCILCDKQAAINYPQLFVSACLCLPSLPVLVICAVLQVHSSCCADLHGQSECHQQLVPFTVNDRHWGALVCVLRCWRATVAQHEPIFQPTVEEATVAKCSLGHPDGPGSSDAHFIPSFREMMALLRRTAAKAAAQPHDATVVGSRRCRRRATKKHASTSV